MKNVFSASNLPFPAKITPEKARQIQETLRRRVIREDRFLQIRLVAGIDVGFPRRENIAQAAIAVLRLPELDLVDYSVARQTITFPYLPGLLSFRETPVILEALQKLALRPDLLLCDGHGIAHPRRFGLASHIGLITGLPTIGVAKTRLIGSHEAVPDKKGAWVPLTHENEIIGAVLRSRVGVKPIYISIGHKISLETAVKIVCRCLTRYRLPETTRRAHRIASGYDISAGGTIP
ncbi:MAG: deoxyribonuclease V [FCB group bacterium]|nr:deoxyribonuclease V [FCB group bacterium]